MGLGGTKRWGGGVLQIFNFGGGSKPQSGELTFMREGVDPSRHHEREFLSLNKTCRTNLYHCVGSECCLFC